MKNIGEYVIVNSLEELTTNKVVWADKTSIRIERYGIFENIDEIDFPHCFKFIEPLDYHCCPSFIPCEKKEVIDYLKNRINEMEKDINEINKI
jgi:hypothetical protein